MAFLGQERYRREGQLGLLVTEEKAAWECAMAERNIAQAAQGECGHFMRVN
jgi:hypothetical protein